MERKTALISDSVKKLDSLSDMNWIRNNSLSVFYARTALALTKSFLKYDSLINAYTVMGNSFTALHKDSSFFYYSMALKIADSLHDSKEIPTLLYNLSNLNIDAGNLKSAIMLLDSGITVARLTQNKTVLSNGFNLMGNICLVIHDSDRAKVMFDSAYRVAVEYKLSRQIGNALGNLADFEKDRNTRISIMKKAISYLKMQPGANEEIALTTINLGLEQTSTDSAMYYYNQAIRESVDGNLPLTEIGAYNNLAYSFLASGRTGEALDCMEKKAIPLARELNNAEWLAELYDTYADVLTSRGDLQHAFKALKTSAIYRSQDIEEKNKQQIRLIAAMLDLKNKETVIRNKESQLQIKTNQNRILRLISLLTFLTIVIIVFVFISFRQRTRIRIRQQQIESARRIIELEETEKSRLGFELHDHLGYLVRVIEGFVHSIKIEDQKIREQLHEKMEELGDRIRRISHHINLLKDSRSVLQDIVPDLINDLINFNGIRVRYFVADHLPEISREITLHFCRIVQELLTNASKYAREAQIRLDIATADNKLLLLYEDDGPGFDPDLAAGKGIGISGIYERVMLLGGTVRLVTAPGKGTKWEISVPL
ncbi:MAG TPA: ATP-binding protein [Bacteroidales bacterium]|nr:ATP-binding protein [Bacteroidales bacterium]